MSTTYFTATPEQSLRARTKALWEAGDLSLVAQYLEPAATEFAGRLPRRPGRQLLDLGCGTGNLATAAARVGWACTGIDLARNLVAQARTRAAKESLPIGFLEADAECLPFPDDSFDCVASFHGVMFAPHFDAAAAELLRTCRPGGLLALAHWTPDGFAGQYLRLLRRHAPLALTALGATRWGEESVLRNTFRNRIVNTHSARRMAHLRFPFPPHQTVEFLRQFHGPTLRAFGSAELSDRTTLHDQLVNLLQGHDRSGGDTTTVEAEYLEFIAEKRESPPPASAAP